MGHVPPILHTSSMSAESAVLRHKTLHLPMLFLAVKNPYLFESSTLHFYFHPRIPDSFLGKELHATLRDWVKVSPEAMAALHISKFNFAVQRDTCVREFFFNENTKNEYP